MVAGRALVLVALVLLLSPSDPRPTEAAEKRALLIAGRPRPGEQMPAFQNDVEHLRDALLNERLRTGTADDWKPDNIRVLVGPTRAEVTQAIADLFGRNADGDLSLLFYTGHGVGHGGRHRDDGEADEGGWDEAWALDPGDAVQDIRDDDLDDLLKDVKGIKVVVVDACHCGGTVGGADDRLLTLPKTIVLLGCAEVEQPQDTDKCSARNWAKSGQYPHDHEHSLFPIQLIAALGNVTRAGLVAADAADKAVQHGRVSVEEWFKYAEFVMTKTLRLLGQRPRLAHTKDIDPKNVFLYTYDLNQAAQNKGFAFEMHTASAGSGRAKCLCGPRDGAERPACQVDSFTAAHGVLRLTDVEGVAEVALVGSATFEVDLGTLADPDGDGLEQVQTEIVQMQLSGLSPVLGPVRLRVRDPERPPFQRSTGELEEARNVARGRLDLPPLARRGRAAAILDAFLEVEFGSGPGDGMVVLDGAVPAEGDDVVGPPGPRLYNDVPLRLVGTAHAKPAGEGDRFVSHDAVALVDEFLGPVGTRLELVLAPTPVVSFARLIARVEIRSLHEFAASALFRLGDASDGIAPLVEPVTLRLGTFALTIPGGSFVGGGGAPFRFVGVVEDVTLKASLRPRGPRTFHFHVEGHGADLADVVSPIAFALAVGDDAGSAIVESALRLAP